MKNLVGRLFFTLNIILTSTLCLAQDSLMHPLILTLELDKAEQHDPASIAQKQESILEALDGHSVINVKRFSHLPQLALTVDDAGKAILEGLPEVKSIHNDGLAYPMEKSSSSPSQQNQTNGEQTSAKGLSKPLSPCKIEKKRE